MAAAKDAATKEKAKPAAKAAEKPETPPVDHGAIIDAVSTGIFDATVARKSHTRFEINGKQIVYAEKRKTGVAIVINSKYLTDADLQKLVTPQPWHGGRSVLMVTEKKSDIQAARRVLKHVVAAFASVAKEAEEAKARTAEERKAKQAADRERKRAEKEAAKAAAAEEEDEEEDDEEDDEDIDDEEEDDKDE